MNLGPNLVQFFGLNVRNIRVGCAMIKFRHRVPQNRITEKTRLRSTGLEGLQTRLWCGSGDGEDCPTVFFEPPELRGLLSRRKLPDICQCLHPKLHR